MAELPDFDRELKRIMSSLDQMEEVQRRLTDIRGVGEAHGGLIKVEVGPSGALLDLTLDPRAMRLDSQSLREAILSASQEALRKVSEEMDGLVSGLIPEGFGDFMTGQGSLGMPTFDNGDVKTSGDPLADARATLEQVRRDLM